MRLLRRSMPLVAVAACVSLLGQSSIPPAPIAPPTPEPAVPQFAELSSRPFRSQCEVFFKYAHLQRPGNQKPVRYWARAKIIEAPDRAAFSAALATQTGPLIVRNPRLAVADLAGARLYDLCFEEGSLDGADMSRITGENLTFMRSTLKGAILDHSRVDRMTFSGSKLIDLHARAAVITDLSLNGGIFDGMTFDRSTLAGLRIECPKVSSVDQCEWPETPISFRDTDIRNARFDLGFDDKWDFTGARLADPKIQIGHVPHFASALMTGGVTVESGGYNQPVSAKLSLAEWGQMQRAWINPELSVGHGRRGGPSFRCVDARTPAEKFICTNDDYRSLDGPDQQLGRLYRAALAAGKIDRLSQRTWLARRETCLSKRNDEQIAECLVDAYAERIAAIGARMPTPPWMSPGAKALFIEDDIPVDDAFKAGKLYRKLIPVIVTNSSGVVNVRLSGRRALVAGGHAWGGNAHMCSMGGRYRLDRGKGIAYEVFPYETAEAPFMRFVGDELSFEKSDKFLWPDSAMCGARAGWGDMTRLPLGAKERRSLQELLGKT